jgi:dTDP-glucose pyrophosphorylase
VNVVVPLMGTGERFKAAGYSMPKPLINVSGKPMIEHAIAPFIWPDFKFTFIIRREYEHLKLPGNKIILDGNTEGAACTVLKAKDIINTSEPLIILNSDQILEFSWLNFHTLVDYGSPDGIIWVFEASGKRWSYAKVGEDGSIIRVAEKDPISPWATCGAYYFWRGLDFVRCAEQMIAEDARVNGEFYVCPVYNWMIREGRCILPFESGMHGLGTPEDLEEYLCLTQFS